MEGVLPRLRNSSHFSTHYVMRALNSPLKNADAFSSWPESASKARKNAANRSHCPRHGHVYTSNSPPCMASVGTSQQNRHWRCQKRNTCWEEKPGSTRCLVIYT